MNCVVVVLAVTFIGILRCEPLSAEEGKSHPRLLSDLPKLLDSKDGIEELYEEFQGVEDGHRRPWTVAEIPQNKKKNRYEDILPFDHSRVVLERLPEDPYSDYINANFIDGASSEHEYIATQGPLPNTINDFWRMIVEQNSTRIVMLANVIEDGKKKVEKYWPDTRATYGKYEITKLSENSIPHLQHVVRIFAIKKPGTEKPQIVGQFHFTGWPDKDVPADRLPVIAIINQARLYDVGNKAPIVVHCSAGVGRTGTTIFTDSMIRTVALEIESNSSWLISPTENITVDFQKRLDRMRTLRPYLVEVKEQYVFAYKAVNDFFNVPGTLEKLKEINEEYKKMDN